MQSVSHFYSARNRSHPDRSGGFYFSIGFFLITTAGTEYYLGSLAAEDQYNSF